MVIAVKETCGAADTGPQGEKLYAAIVPLLAQRDEIAFSFAGIDIAASSFVNTSLVRLLSHVSFDEIKRRLKIVNSTHQINDMIKRRLMREGSLAAE